MSSRKPTREHTSMRGRLALLVFGLVAGPMLVVGVVGYTQLRQSLDDIDSRRDVDASNASLLDATRAASSFHHELENSLRDLAERTSRLDSTVPEAVAEAFGDLPETLRPTVIAELRPSGASRPPLAPAVLDALHLPDRDWRRQCGYLLLPPEAADTCPVLHQVVIDPREGGRALVVLRRLDGPTGGALIEALPGLDEGRRSIVRPTESGGLVDLPVCGTLWTRAIEQRQAGAVRPVAVPDPQNNSFAGAVLLSDLSGNPVALATVSVVDIGPSKLFQEYSTLFAKVLTTLSVMAVIGLAASLALGLLGPRCVWGQIRGATEFIFQSVERLRELVRRNSRALDEQSEVIQRLTQSLTALRTDSQTIAETARNLAQTASQSARVTQSGNQQAEQTKAGVSDLREQIGELSAQMEDLERRCNEIGAILAFLNHLNNETNTLSVNATIQAAGSDVAGSRQLSVMAGEIGKLADLTRDSMQDIQQINERIQESSRTTLGATQEGRLEVEACLKCCAELESSFGRILRWVDETTQSAHGIERSTARQSQSLETVSTSIEALERRSRETVGNFQDVVMAAEELAELGLEMNRTWKVG